MLNIDAVAPDVTLNTNGKTIKLSDLRGKNTVLYFYPKDMTSG
jgi:peroxiredoxin Q/BCP